MRKAINFLIFLGQFITHIGKASAEILPAYDDMKEKNRILAEQERLNKIAQGGVIEDPDNREEVKGV